MAYRTAKRSGFMFCYPMEERRLTDPKFGWSFPVIVQPKLDGERCRPIPNIFPEETFLISSECNPIISVPHINYALDEQWKLKYQPDGELYHHGWDFNDIHSVVSRKSEATIHPEAHKIEYHIFDYVSNERQIERTSILADLEISPPLVIVQSYVAKDLDEVMHYYDMFLEMGYEGIIIRHLAGTYIHRRSTFILKFKPKKSDEYEIVEALEAISKDGIPLNMLGALRCVGADGTIFKIGAGKLKHERRKYLWSIKDQLPGEFCKAEYQSAKSGTPRFGLAVDVLI